MGIVMQYLERPKPAILRIKSEKVPRGVIERAKRRIEKKRVKEYPGQDLKLCTVQFRGTGMMESFIVPNIDT